MVPFQVRQLEESSKGKMVREKLQTLSLETEKLKSFNLKRTFPFNRYCPKCRGKNATSIKKEIADEADKYKKYKQRKTINSSMSKTA